MRTYSGSHENVVILKHLRSFGKLCIMNRGRPHVVLSEIAHVNELQVLFYHRFFLLISTH